MQQRFLLQILMLAQHVSGNTMPIIRSSRIIYSGCCLWYLVLWFICVEIKCQLDATEVFIADLIACSTCFGHHYAHHQELKNNIQWFLPVVFGALVYICGNKMPTRCNRGFYCRSYCLLNMFRATLCPSSGDQEYYTVVAACGIWCCGLYMWK